MNVKAEETDGARRARVGRAGDDAAGAWLAGGSYLAARRINMTIEVWDRQPLRRPGGVHRPHQGHRRAAVRRRGVRPARLRRCAGRERPRSCPSTPTSGRAPRPQRRRPDAAPRLQLRRRHRRDRRPERRAVLPRLPRATRAPTSSRSSSRWSRRRADGVPQVHRLARCSRCRPASVRGSTSGSRCSPDAGMSFWPAHVGTFRIGWCRRGFALTSRGCEPSRCSWSCSTTPAVGPFQRRLRRRRRLLRHLRLPDHRRCCCARRTATAGSALAGFYARRARGGSCRRRTRAAGHAIAGARRPACSGSSRRRPSRTRSGRRSSSRTSGSPPTAPTTSPPRRRRRRSSTSGRSRSRSSSTSSGRC